ncbi:tyrosine-type recombinase/integrase, partial [Halarchaeum salinum]|uniref:tyrosine-type recombinase/integrase n=1 Tax=Halarchaeum salinum TaxID=489912 RepID=UPI0031DCEDAE
MEGDDDLSGIRIATEETVERLNQRQLVDYTDHRESFLRWLLHMGKAPSKGDGYAHDTVRRRADDTDRFYRWLWSENEGYTTFIDTEDAETYCHQLAYKDHSNSYKRNQQNSLMSLFKWRHHRHGEEDWDPSIRFGSDGDPTQPQDYFTKEERRRLREASLEYGTVPHYNSLTPSERQEWKRHLASRFLKPMDEIGAKQFERANGFKIPSLVNAALDAALRPIEVSRAKVGWVDAENAVLRIPSNESAKSDEAWLVSLREQTASMLEKWIDERRLYSKYDDTDVLWLTRENNPYQSHSLKYLLTRLCEEAGIEEGSCSVERRRPLRIVSLISGDLDA